MYELPTSLIVNGVERKIRTDFRIILSVLIAMNDPELEQNEKSFVLLYDIYEDFDSIPENDIEEAFKKAVEFMDYGMKDSKKSSKRTVDFEQDERLLMAAINKIVGYEVRSVEYMHWYTFMGYFMEIGEGVYSTVLNIRNKRAEGKSLEKWEQEFFNNNKDICIIKERLTEEEKKEKELLKKLLGL